MIDELVTGPRAQHLLAHAAPCRRGTATTRCSGPPSRRRRARRRWAVGQPQVLADRDGAEGAAGLQASPCRPARERALLVEHAVVRQVLLVVPRRDLHRRRAAARSCARGRGRATASRPAAARRRAPASDSTSRRQASRNADRNSKVLGRVAGDRELRREHEVDVVPRGLGTGLGDPARRSRRAHPPSGRAGAARVGARAAVVFVPTAFERGDDARVERDRGVSAAASGVFGRLPEMRARRAARARAACAAAAPRAPRAAP